MTEDEGTDEEEDSMTYDETSRKQSKKDFLLVALGLPGLALLCASIIAFWAIGYKTPQNATSKDWVLLVGVSAMLIGIVSFASLAAFALFKNRRARIQRKIVRTIEMSMGGVLVVTRLLFATAFS